MPKMPAAARAEPKMASPMPASPQNSSSSATGQGQPGRVAHGVGHEVEPVQPVAGRLLHDGPRELLPFVPLVRGRPHDVLREVVHPLLDLLLVLVEIEREVGHARKLPVSNLRHNSLRRVTVRAGWAASQQPQRTTQGGLSCHVEPVPSPPLWPEWPPPACSSLSYPGAPSAQIKRRRIGRARADRLPAPHQRHAPRSARVRDHQRCPRAPGGVPAHRRQQRRHPRLGHARASTDRPATWSRSCGTPAIRPACSAFDFPFFEQLSRPVFEQTAPTARTFVEDTDFATMDFSGSGDVTAPITPVDLLLPPVGGSTSGCEPADFAGFPAGNVALIQRGTCRLRRQGRQRRGRRRLGGDHLQRGQLLP